MNFWQVVYLAILAASLLAATWNTVEYARKEDVKPSEGEEGEGAGKSIEGGLGVFVASFIFIAFCATIVVLIITAVVQAHNTVWTWLGCLSGC